MCLLQPKPVNFMEIINIPPKKNVLRHNYYERIMDVNLKKKKKNN